MCTLRELDLLVPWLQLEANVGLELVDDGPLVPLVHDGDIDLLDLLDECDFVDWHAPPPPRTPPPTRHPPPLSTPPSAKRRKHRRVLYTMTTPVKVPFAPALGAEKASCRCRKSRCLKLYCECFASGTACTAMCQCNDCHNFADAPPRKVAKPCNCRRSQCRTGYCECFAARRACTHACSCTGCANCH